MKFWNKCLKQDQIRWQIILNSSLILISNLGFAQQPTNVLVEDIELPTYSLGEDEPNPLFKDYTFPGFDVFRGDRSVYPYPLQDEFSSQSELRNYKAVLLENEYIKTTIIPDLRGRMQGAVDKRNNWDFIYYNNVIKPADIAVRMAWIAGGLEWNHPGGHGYTQFTKIPYIIKEYEDGSKSVIVSEIEPVRQMKWETEIKLSPKKLYLETICRLISIAPYPVPFASSLNGAMHTSDELEIILPKGSYYTGHGKNSLHKWPFYNGLDVSWYKNTKDVFSVFVEGEGLFKDYWGCYSHDPDIDAGTVIVADHRFAPGKKYFTWGAHDKARLWDTFLSDQDGGYIELQVQAFWDNLGYGYAWLYPQEVKEFTVYWYPLSKTGGFVAATREACLNLTQHTEKEIELVLQSTGFYDNATITCLEGEDLVFSKKVHLSPEHPESYTFNLTDENNYGKLKVFVSDSEGHFLINYETASSATEAPVMPDNSIKPFNMSMDQLYAKAKSWYQDPFGLEAEKSYRMMLSIDSLESRANKEMGIIMWYRYLLDSSLFYFKNSLINDPLNESAQTYFSMANVNIEKGNYNEAKDQLAYSIRNKDFFSYSALCLGDISILEKNYSEAIIYYNEALSADTHHSEVMVKLAIAMRLSNLPKEAERICRKALVADPLSFYAIAESWIGNYDYSPGYSTERLNELFDRDDPCFVGSQLYLYTASKYMELGLWNESLKIISQAITYYEGKGESVYPLLFYYAGYCYSQINEEALSLKNYSRGMKSSNKYVFPYSKMDWKVLMDANNKVPHDYNTLLYLGNISAWKRRHIEAISYWESALMVNEVDPIVYHNLAGALWATTHKTEKAIDYLEKGLRLKPDDTRLILELDHLYQHAGKTEKRFRLYETHRDIIELSDDLVLRYCQLNIKNKNYDAAITWMTDHTFFPREANHVEPVVITIYAEAFIGKGIKMLEVENYSEALDLFHKARNFPSNLNDIAPEIFVTTRLDYYTGLALKGIGRKQDANRLWQNSINSTLRKGFECEVYLAKILKETGNNDKAEQLIQNLIILNLEKIKVLTESASLSVAHITLYEAFKMLNEDQKAQIHLKKALDYNKDAILKSRIQAAHVPIIST